MTSFTLNKSTFESHRLRKLTLTVLVIVGVLIVIRLVLPWAVTRYLNDRLASLGDYYGHIEDVDLALWRGAYVVHELIIEKKNSTTGQAFLVAPQTDLSIQWSSIMAGEPSAEISMREPELNLVQGDDDAGTQLGTGTRWSDVMMDFVPIQINRLSVTNGRARFRAPGISVEESLQISNLGLIVNNLANVEDAEQEAFTDFELNGTVMSDAPLTIYGSIDPNEADPTFDINISLENTRLTDVNPWLAEFIGVDAEAGDFSLYAEFATADRRFRGYLQPVLEHADLFRLGEEDENVFKQAWEALVDLASNVLENPKEKQVATRVPFSGELEDPDADIIATIVNLARNAFVVAFARSIEGIIDIEDVELPGGDTPEE